MYINNESSNLRSFQSTLVRREQRIEEKCQKMEVKSVLWFRHGLRLGDNPALLEAVKKNDAQRLTFYPVFIFDGESAGNEAQMFKDSH
jgi:DNA photolyase